VLLVGHHIDPDQGQFVIDGDGTTQRNDGCAVALGISGELLGHCRIHGHMMERLKLDTPRPGKGSPYELDSRSFALGDIGGIDGHDPRPA
jgi:hypothetical protein